MAFYPDELSPIDRIRSLGKSSDHSDLNLLKNRRQWKSLVLGKKEMGLNNFATITEEKEEDISSDGSQISSNLIKEENITNSSLSSDILNKKITFSKPRKYITSRLAERKEDLGFRNLNSHLFSLERPNKDHLSLEVKKSSHELHPNASSSPKPSSIDLKHLLRTKKSRERDGQKLDFIDNFNNPTPIEAQWADTVAESSFLLGWSQALPDKSILKQELVETSQEKAEDKKKVQLDNKPVQESLKAENKKPKKKDVTLKKVQLPKQSKDSIQKNFGKPIPNKPKPKPKPKLEKGKSLNMKDVVNVYKNLTYGSKDKIKSFVENLSYVKDEAENDKNLLSVMNLKVLENKIKNFTKKSIKSPEPKPSTEKKPKMVKTLKRNRKAHIERLARHKIVRVPGALNPNKIGGSNFDDRFSITKKNEKSLKNKEPWKYVGMESALDKAYFVYPAYPSPSKLKKTEKRSKPKEKAAEEKKETSPTCPPPKTTSAPKPGPKVKPTEIVSRQNFRNKTDRSQKTRSGSSRSTNTLKLSSSVSNKSMNRPSATTVCTVEFRPSNPQKSVEEPDPTDPSLLVCLHGTKALNVKTPYSDKQFSRVKFFRKDGKGYPLIKGLDRKAFFKNYPKVTIRNISLPDKLCSVRSFDLLDFEEDIENINEFLHSLNSPDRKRQEERAMVLKSERESPKESRRHKTTDHLQHQQHHNHHHHQHGTLQQQLSFDSIVNEITQNIQHLQYLPDTEENKKLIAEFFDELDRRIDETRNVEHFEELTNPDKPFTPIPILGY